MQDNFKWALDLTVDLERKNRKLTKDLQELQDALTYTFLSAKNLKGEDDAEKRQRIFTQMENTLRSFISDKSFINFF